MDSLVVIGLQWGDEGKGKIIDVLSEKFDIVARFQGGSNAGHTIKIGEVTHKFRLLPSGAVRGRKVVIGNGVVVDPIVLNNEIEELKKQGIDVNILISERAQVITPFHVMLDGLQEKFKGRSKVGTTRRGIGPAYSDKITRVGLRICDLLDRDENLIEFFERFQTARIEKLYQSHVSNADLENIIRILNDLRPNIGDCGRYLYDALKKGKRILFEGAQGTLLDIDHGTYPYVTSSNCISAAASTGTGIPPFAIRDVIGVFKAYLTRVGEGPFPTEISGPVGERIQTHGREFGTVTGRSRRCGWLDLVALKYAIRLNGAKYLALTKLDVLTGINPLRVCVKYRLDGTNTDNIPAFAQDMSRVKPVYKELPGWEKPAKSWEILASEGIQSLPEEMRRYIEFIEKETDCMISIISLGPDRDETMIIRNKMPSWINDV